MTVPRPPDGVGDGAGLRVGVVQCASGARPDPEGLLGAAAQRGIDVLVLPELYLCGYGAAALARAEPRDGPFARRVAAAAAAAGVAVAYGYPERDGALYNAAALVGADGALLAHHRKAHLYGRWEQATFTPGDGAPPVATVRGTRVAVLICYDVEFPEYVRAAVLAGADVVLVPTANPTGFEDVQRILVPARAFENQCFVAYANFRLPGFGGLSTVAGPDGSVLARAGDAEDALLCADLSHARIDAARTDQCYLTDRRPDLYGPDLYGPAPDGPAPDGPARRRPGV